MSRDTQFDTQFENRFNSCVGCIQVFTGKGFPLLKEKGLTIIGV